MIRHLDLWYDFMDDESCQWYNHGVLLNTVDEMLVRNEPIDGRICRVCAQAFLRLNRHGMCPDLFRQRNARARARASIESEMRKNVQRGSTERENRQNRDDNNINAMDIERDKSEDEEFEDVDDYNGMDNDTDTGSSVVSAPRASSPKKKTDDNTTHCRQQRQSSLVSMNTTRDYDESAATAISTTTSTSSGAKKRRCSTANNEDPVKNKILLEATRREPLKN